MDPLVDLEGTRDVARPGERSQLTRETPHGAHVGRTPILFTSLATWGCRRLGIPNVRYRSKLTEPFQEHVRVGFPTNRLRWRQPTSQLILSEPLPKKS